ncbi:Thioesterase-like superfamily protein [Nocardioides terrae]|uniref:Thioesterase-like superfamily protein n=1 Tax=Nocardioides terrae TaxID=574651 RepID=A0A1I1DQJ5_9ACTN|nr:thioesterase family protein [Nocardioides terrae]SFB76696.1 Thioesterase-like superfamily protein [Nocardioides terrae]
MPYFLRTGDNAFTPTEHVSGAWRTDEQHVAPALGVMTHAVEGDHRQRRGGDALAVSRLSFDILGVLPMAECEVDVRVVRPGRTIELVEAVLSHAGRPAVVLRAWLLARGDTTDLSGTHLPALPEPGSLPAWDPTTVWPGGFIASAQLRRDETAPGRARYWVRTDVPLLDEETSPLASAAGLLDIANGMTVRASPSEVLFPNVDLTAHLVRTPAPGWLGFDTTVTFGPDGHGLTSSVLHDSGGPLGTLAQTLTVRPL